jgi:hypothetical protein
VHPGVDPQLQVDDNGDGEGGEYLLDHLGLFL